MIALIKKAIIDYLESELDDTLMGIKSIVSGPVISQSIPNAKYPFISVYNEDPKVTFQLGTPDPPMEIQSFIILELYTQSGKGIGEAEDECLQLFLSNDKNTGLLKALQKQLKHTAGTDVFLAIPSKEINLRAGDKTEDNFTYAGRITLKVDTKI